MDRLALAATLSVNFQNKFDYSVEEQHGMLADLSFKSADAFIAQQKAWEAKQPIKAPVEAAQ